VRARKLTYFTDRNFTERCLPPPRLVRADHTATRRITDDWSGRTSSIDVRLEQPWSDLVSSAGRMPDQVPAHERAPELPGGASADLDLLRDDDGAPSIQADDATVVDRHIVDDDLAPAL
jgi:type IV secretion system protein VirD4